MCEDRTGQVVGQSPIIERWLGICNIRDRNYLKRLFYRIIGWDFYQYTNTGIGLIYVGVPDYWKPFEKNNLPKTFMLPVPPGVMPNFYTDFHQTFYAVSHLPDVGLEISGDAQNAFTAKCFGFLVKVHFPDLTFALMAMCAEHFYPTDDLLPDCEPRLVKYTGQKD